jgi:mRNA interferase RelE/StbE
MEKYKVLIRASAIKELENVPIKSLEQIVKRIESLSDNPWPKGSQKLSAQERYRIRQGDYRIIYSILDDLAAVHIYKIGHRREVYCS